MPELPDAVVYRQSLERNALDRPLRGVTVLDDRILGEGHSPARLDAVLSGTALTATHRHGKHVFARYGEETGWVAFHFGMTGRLRFYEGDDVPEYAYLQFHFADGGNLAVVCPRKFARVRLIDTPGAFIEAKELGPDARRADWDTVRARFEGRWGTIKGALLNQKVLAGLGNIYADEALYQAGIHSRTRIPELDRNDLHRLYEAIHEVLEAAIEADADPTALDPDRFMLPHRYDDECCPETGVPLETETISGRTAYFSPACQSPPMQETPRS